MRKNATVTFNAIGAGSANEEVHGNERYIPVEYQVGSKSVEITGGEAAVSRSFKVASAGTYKVQVTFQNRYTMPMQEMVGNGKTLQTKLM